MTVLRGFGEEIAFQRTASGMAVFVMAKPGYARKFAQISVGYGSNDMIFTMPSGHAVGAAPEPQKWVTPAGVAHFLEHKMFDRAEGNAFEAFSSLGASANAFTGNDITSYMFWTVDAYHRCLELLFELVWKPYFTPESVLKEQGIIDQEILMYEDDPYSRLHRAVLQNLYHIHPVRVDVTGTRDSIRQVTSELLYLCHGAFYRPSNMVLFVAGDFDAPSEAARIAEIIDRTVEDSGPPPVKERPEEPPGPLAASARLRVPVSRPFVGIGWKDEPAGADGVRLVKREIATNLLLDILFGKSSTVFARLYEKGLVDDLGASYDAWPDYAFASLTAETPEPDRFVEEVLKEVERAQRAGIERHDFERAKKAAWGRYITLFDDLDVMADSQTQLYFVGQDVFSYGSLLEGVDRCDIEERLGILRPDRLTCVFLLPAASDRS